jgi:predicted permease
MKSSNVFGYIVAFFLPILLFTELLNNYNEKNGFVVYLTCIALFAVAGVLASKGFPTSGRLKWIGLSVAIGIAEAFGLTVLV